MPCAKVKYSRRSQAHAGTHTAPRNHSGAKYTVQTAADTLQRHLREDARAGRLELRLRAGGQLQDVPVARAQERGGRGAHRARGRAVGARPGDAWREGGGGATGGTQALWASSGREGGGVPRSGRPLRNAASTHAGMPPAREHGRHAEPQAPQITGPRSQITDAQISAAPVLIVAITRSSWNLTAALTPGAIWGRRPLTDSRVAP